MSKIRISKCSYHTSLGKGLFGYNGSTLFPLQITLFLPFQNGGNAIFTAETVTQRNVLIFAKGALRELGIVNGKGFHLMDSQSAK